jgi:hypothetical protein
MHQITTSITTGGDACSPHHRVSFDRSKEHLQRLRASLLTKKGREAQHEGNTRIDGGASPA